MLLRNLLVLRQARRRSALGIHDVGRMPMRVRLADIDLLRHINNGVYLSLMDLGRIDLMIRAGRWDRMRAAGMYPVVVAETIAFRRSLDFGARYELETRVLGYDARNCYLEQRFVAGGEIHARGVVAARFLRRRGGSVPVDELLELFGVDADERVLPEWVPAWLAAVQLPSNRTPAPSVWDD